MLLKAGEVMVGESEETAMKDKGQKDVCRRTWMQQMDIKRQERLINDELLRKPKDSRLEDDIKRDEEMPLRTTLF